MRTVQLLLIAVQFLIPSIVLSAQTDIQEGCRDISMTKYVIRLDRDFHKVSVCTVQSYVEVGEQCDSEWNHRHNVQWTQIIDLNNDGNFDVVLISPQSGMWRGTDTYTIFAGCGNGVFLKVMDDEGLGNIGGTIRNSKSPWASIKAKILHSADDDYIAFYEQEAIFVFDPNSFKYKMSSKGKIGNEPTDGPEKTYMRTPPTNFKITWGKFPSSIPKNLLPITDDGTKDACKNARQLIGFSTSPRSDKNQRYVNLCPVAVGKGPCIAPVVDQADYVYRDGWHPDKADRPTGLYGWYGRFLADNTSYPDLVAFSRNSTELHEFSLYLRCPPYNAPSFLKIMKGSFTDISYNNPDEKHLFADIHATRHCPNKSTGQLQSRTFVLKFDPAKFEYGPPNGDPALVTPCSDKEMALPFKVVK
jgi:hypothetical protein